MKSMKMFAALFCTAIVLAFTSCSKDDIEKDIVGTWKGISATYTETYNGETRTETMDYEDELRLIFNDDKTFKTTYNGEVDGTGTWSVKDDKLTMDFGENETETYKVNIDGNDMTLSRSESYGESSFTMVIKLKRV
jgi:uncharacterized lipoprotein YehR (DUF1307 family)